MASTKRKDPAIATAVCIAPSMTATTSSIATAVGLAAHGGTANSLAHARLELLQQPPSEWYKDQNGRKATFTLRVKKQGGGCAGCASHRHLNVQLLYQNGKVVDNQEIMRVTAGLCLDSLDESTLAIRISEVSKNHQNQRFRVKIQLPTCHAAPATLPAAVITEPILVLSKKNKRSAVKAAPDQDGSTPKKSKTDKDVATTLTTRDHQETPERVEPVAAARALSFSSGVSSSSFDTFSDFSNRAEPIVRFASNDSVSLWANAAYNFLHKLQWLRLPGNDSELPFGCPSCCERFASEPKHTLDCDLAMLLQQSEMCSTGLPTAINANVESATDFKPPLPALARGISSVSTLVDEQPEQRLSQMHYSFAWQTSKETPAWQPSKEAPAKSINLSSWEGYSSLSKIMFSMETEKKGAENPAMGNIKTESGYPANNNAVLLNISEVPEFHLSKHLSVDFSRLVDEKTLPAGAAAILKEHDEQLNGDANLLCSLSRVSLSEIFNDDSSSNDKDDCSSNSNANDKASRVSQDHATVQKATNSSVCWIVSEDFHNCGFPALDQFKTLIGFYLPRSEPGSLRFFPELYPLPVPMMKEFQAALEKWEKDGKHVHQRRPREAPDAFQQRVFGAHDQTSSDWSTTMAKHDFLTPKAIANRIKAKGLQKLRWFCQVCQKQCRDENGFKCHTSSESHQRQMLIVANNPDKFMSEYSEQFETAFLENLRRRHSTTRVRANVVYNEYIQDKLHVHMNATQWTTLNSFVQYLGRTGKCMVDETEKGWYIQYIDRDPRKLARQQELEKKQKSDLDHEERNRLFIERQLKLAQQGEAADDSETTRPTKLQRTDDGEKIKISLSSALKTKDTVSSKPVVASTNVFEAARDDKRLEDQKSGKLTATEQLMRENERHKEQNLKKRHMEEEKTARSENWIAPGIVVKVLNKKLAGGRYHKQKGVIKAVEDKFCATVEMLETQDTLKLDQDDLETVIPKVGRRVKIVNGRGRGSVAKLLCIDIDRFCVDLEIDSGSRRGEILKRVEYEDISRLAEE
ncbi:TPA: hypothetical protein N0F65_012535 [Lagenidium giganteum]|uniref:DNA/RNA-binding protein Kin17 WH-like domain-containing protein n=1 Tax=Lagenidium giganteum TaxID=4803 RepID=A0AAV2YL43_9STRA|nr:TPA: hypothetical protein N0F65_012535 [Lagenidium giganteum]